MEGIAVIFVIRVKTPLVFMQIMDKKLIRTCLTEQLSQEVAAWYFETLTKTLENKSGKELYLMYSLCGSKLTQEVLNTTTKQDEALTYFIKQEGTVLQLGRINVLIQVLEKDAAFFGPKVENLIQLADTGELETFLKFLVLLPNAERYIFTAVEALRTNIATIFDAIAMNNPYPQQHFNEQQWNQMYLKAAFMERNLGCIIGVEERGNQALTRIISDYAHERWAASREIDPEIWKPVASFIDDTLLKDMERLFRSSNQIENRVAALSCAKSNTTKAKELLEEFPQLKAEVESGNLTWQNFKN